MVNQCRVNGWLFAHDPKVQLAHVGKLRAEDETEHWYFWCINTYVLIVWNSETQDFKLLPPAPNQQFWIDGCPATFNTSSPPTQASHEILATSNLSSHLSAADMTEWDFLAQRDIPFDDTTSLENDSDLFSTDNWDFSAFENYPMESIEPTETASAEEMARLQEQAETEQREKHRVIGLLEKAKMENEQLEANLEHLRRICEIETSRLASVKTGAGMDAEAIDKAWASQKICIDALAARDDVGAQISPEPQSPAEKHEVVLPPRADPRLRAPTMALTYANTEEVDMDEEDQYENSNDDESSTSLEEENRNGNARAQQRREEIAARDHDEEGSSDVSQSDGQSYDSDDDKEAQSDDEADNTYGPRNKFRNKRAENIMRRDYTEKRGNGKQRGNPSRKAMAFVAADDEEEDVVNEQSESEEAESSGASGEEEEEDDDDDDDGEHDDG